MGHFDGKATLFNDTFFYLAWGEKSLIKPSKVLTVEIGDILIGKINKHFLHFFFTSFFFLSYKNFIVFVFLSFPFFVCFFSPSFSPTFLFLFHLHFPFSHLKHRFLFLLHHHSLTFPPQHLSRFLPIFYFHFSTTISSFIFSISILEHFPINFLLFLPQRIFLIFVSVTILFHFFYNCYYFCFSSSNILHFFSFILSLFFLNLFFSVLFFTSNTYSTATVFFFLIFFRHFSN